MLSFVPEGIDVETNFILQFAEHAMAGRGCLRYSVWTGVMLLSSVLGRSHYTRTSIGKIYGNLFVLLSGKPGVGKGIVVSKARDLMGDAKVILNRESKMFETDHQTFMTADSFTTSSLVESLKTSGSTRQNGTTLVSRDACTLSDEVMTFFNAFNLEETYAMLCNLWDCPAHISRARSRYEKKDSPGSGTIRVELPYYSMITCGQPEMIRVKLNKHAWDNGFMSRLAVVHEEHDRTDDDIFMEVEDDKEADASIEPLPHADKLAMTLAKVMSTVEPVPIGVSPCAVKELKQWNLATNKEMTSRLASVPRYPQLKAMWVRNKHMNMKLVLISAIARGSTKIEKVDVQFADWIRALSDSSVHHMIESTVSATMAAKQTIQVYLANYAMDASNSMLDSNKNKVYPTMYDVKIATRKVNDTVSKHVASNEHNMGIALVNQTIDMLIMDGFMERVMGRNDITGGQFTECFKLINPHKKKEAKNAS